MKNRLFFVLAFGIGLTSCSSSSGSDDGHEGANGWILQQGVNKFTDKNVAYAQKVFVLDDAQITIEIKCSNTTINYIATAFDANGTELDFKTDSGWDYYGKPYNNTPVTMRFDDNEAFTFSAPVKRYTNQITILPRLEQQQITDAKMALLRLNFLDRTIDLEIDHDSSIIDEVVSPCDQRRNLQAEQSRIDEGNRQAEIKANIEAQYDDDAVSSDDLRSRLENNGIKPNEDRLNRKFAREEARQAKLDTQRAARQQASQKEIDDYNRLKDLERKKRLDEIARRNAESKAESDKAQRDADNHLRELERISKEQRGRY
ncbi:hypothetical protein [Parasphingorhabdus sp.]|uniref:hypothetical protein n=1 Tax=Parasphingorhabdus sp. TaxID=2709688 RepID=UPI003D283DD5